MKYLAILALAAMTLSLGACSSKTDSGYSTTQSSSTTASTGYSK